MGEEKNKNVFEAKLSTKNLWAPLNGHFVLSAGRKLLYEIDPKPKTCSAPIRRHRKVRKPTQRIKEDYN